MTKAVKRRKLSEAEVAEVRAFGEQIVEFTGWPMPVSVYEEYVRRTGKGSFEESIAQACQIVFERFGIKIGQLLLAYTSLWNGCRYCSRAHMLSANMLYFDEGSLFPISEAHMVAFETMNDTDVITQTRRLLADTHADVLAVLERQYSVHRGDSTADDGVDPFVRLSLGCWSWFNEASIAAFTEEDFNPAFGDPRLRDAELRARYEAARAAR